MKISDLQGLSWVVCCVFLFCNCVVADEFLASFLTKSENDSTVCLKAPEVILKPEFVDPEKDLEVYADRVIIEGDLSLPEKKVRIHSRSLECRKQQILNGNSGRGRYQNTLKEESTCQAENMLPLTREACQLACGARFGDLWAHYNPGCFEVVAGPHQGNCHWNTNPAARGPRKHNHQICDAYPCQAKFTQNSTLGCLGDCINDNTAYPTLETAQNHCALTQGCTRILHSAGKFYLRKADDSVNVENTADSFMEFGPCYVCSIDVSGTDGAEVSSSAPNGQNRNVDADKAESGEDGKDGNAGGHGGDIQISFLESVGAFSLTANGGAGGKGQQGGKGADGADRSRTTVKPYCGAGSKSCFYAPGRRGGGGGDGGQTGESGPGGNGGNVNIYSLCATLKSKGLLTIDRECTEDGWAISALGGQGGQSGEASQGGKGGAGGPGAKGGRIKSKNNGRGPDRGKYTCALRYCDKDRVGAHGQRGANGASKHGLAGTDGQRGEFGVHEEVPTSLFLYNIMQLQLQLQEIRRFLLSKLEDRSEQLAMESLLYIVAITDNAPVGAPAQVINSRCRNWLRQVLGGLDLLGRPEYWVPVSSLQQHDDLLAQMLALGSVLENSYMQLVRQAEDQKEQLSVAQSVASKIEEYIEHLKTRLEDNSNEIARLQSLLDRLGLERRLRYLWLLNAEEGFTEQVNRQKRAANKKQGINDLFSVLTIASAAVAYKGLNIKSDKFAGGVGFKSSITGPIRIINTLNNNINRVVDGKNGKADPYFVEAVNTMGDATKLGDIERIWNQIQVDAGNAEPSLGTGTLEYTKFILPSKRWEEMMADYINLPAGLRYQDAMRAFLNISDVYNKAQIDYTSLHYEREELRFEIVESQAALRAAHAEMTLVGSQGASQYQEMIYTYYHNIRVSISRLTQEQIKAQEYHLLSPVKLTFEDRTIAFQSHLQMSIKQLRQAQDAVHGSPPLQFMGGRATVVVSPETFPDAFLEGSVNNSIMFQLPLGHEAFRGMADVRLTKVRIWVEGLDECSTVWVTLTHSGAANILSDGGEEFSFQHDSRAASFAYQCDSKDIFVHGSFVAEANKFIKLSPFTLWTIHIDQKLSRPKEEKDACGCSEGLGWSSGTSTCTPSSKTSESEAAACADVIPGPFDIKQVKAFRLEFFGTFRPLRKRRYIQGQILV